VGTNGFVADSSVDTISAKNIIITPSCVTTARRLAQPPPKLLPLLR